ncbi:hypothetical protein ACFP2T_34225 [Plantactinospora solaniradicis]|uniref:Uncharacterized protein n=1 Tax=Plantactinospora solaniradicis TaxID=1723736 RepID=A0ABW1KJS8_9ACTN
MTIVGAGGPAAPALGSHGFLRKQDAPAGGVTCRGILDAGGRHALVASTGAGIPRRDA